MISTATYKLLVASKVKGVGKRTLIELARERLFFELEPQHWHLDIPQLRSLEPSSPQYSKALAQADRDVEAAERQRGAILSVRDASYPELLLQVNDRPAILYVRGSSVAFSEKAVAIIGTREPTKHGETTAFRIASYFAMKGWQIVSGLAIGLDTVAHEATLLSHGSTVAVLAHGLESVYPKQNTILAHRILDSGGLLVSEYPYGTPSFPSHFVERDRIQAALSKAVITVQTGKSGGSWHASRAALRYGRRLAVPAPTSVDEALGEPKVQGNVALVTGTTSAKMALLKCEISDLSRLTILRSRDDYPEFERVLLEPAASPSAETTSDTDGVTR